jgi:hypothetical protein
MALQLTMAFSDNPRVQPLTDGTVKPQGIDLNCITVEPSQLFQRNLTHDDFDVSEMSISETLLARERGDGAKWNWAALPVFLSRGLFWANLRRAQSTYLYFPGTDFQQQAAILGEDPYPLGIQAMGKNIERAIQGSLEQGLLTRSLRLEDVYFRTTLDT